MWRGEGCVTIACEHAGVLAFEDKLTLQVFAQVDE